MFVKGSSDGGGGGAAAAAAATIGAISVLSSLPTRLSKWASSLEQEASRDKASWHLARLPPHRVRHGLRLQPSSETSTGLVKNGGANCCMRGKETDRFNRWASYVLARPGSRHRKLFGFTESFLKGKWVSNGPWLGYSKIQKQI